MRVTLSHSMEGRQGYEVGVLGGGPAGLTAAYVLAKQGRRHVVFEADALVGGIARTEVRDGYRFDLGGHRFFTKAPEVELLWHEVLGDELLVRPRKSRIYYNRRYLDYPLAAGNVVKSLGPVELTRAVASYGAALTRRRGREETFEEWVTNRFGRRLYNMFFRSYTEKVWGVPCTELRAEWAAQRISASRSPPRRRPLPRQPGQPGQEPHRGVPLPAARPGMMWEAMRDRIETLGGEVRMEARIDRLGIEDGRVVEVRGQRRGRRVSTSSPPCRSPSPHPSPTPPRPIRAPCRRPPALPRLHHRRARDRRRGSLPRQLGLRPRLRRQGRAHPELQCVEPGMVPDAGKSCVGHGVLLLRGRRALEPQRRRPRGPGRDRARPHRPRAEDEVEEGWVFRVPNAYPVYDSEYAAVNAIRRLLDGITNSSRSAATGSTATTTRTIRC